MEKRVSALYVAAWLVGLTVLELSLYPLIDLGAWRIWGLLILMSAKALMVALVYMNLKQEGWALKLAFFAPIPVAIYFLLFMLYDAAFVWRS